MLTAKSSLEEEEEMAESAFSQCRVNNDNPSFSAANEQIGLIFVSHFLMGIYSCVLVWGG